MKLRNKITSIIMTILCIFTLSTLFPNQSYAVPNSVNITNRTTYSNNIQSGNYIYFAVDNMLYKVNIKTQKTTRLIKMKNATQIFDVSVYNNYVYFTSVNKNNEKYQSFIYKIKTDGNYLKKLAQGFSINIINGNIYYIKCSGYFNGYKEEKNIGIYKMSTSGTNSKPIIKSNGIYDMKMNNSYIYYKKSQYSNIYKINLSGKSYGYISNTKNHRVVLFTKNDLYTQYVHPVKGNLALKKFNFSTKKWENIKSNVLVVAAKNNYIYFIDQGKSTVTLYSKNITTNKTSRLMSTPYFLDLQVASKYIICTALAYKDPYKHCYLLDNNGTTNIDFLKFKY